MLQVVADDCELKDHVTGASAGDAGSALALRSCSVTSSRGCGVAAYAAARVAVVGGRVVRSVQHGIVCRHARSELLLDGVRVASCGGVGVCVIVMGHATLARCLLTMNQVAGLQVTVRQLCHQFRLSWAARVIACARCIGATQSTPFA